jgi:hypothetical protein
MIISSLLLFASYSNCKDQYRKLAVLIFAKCRYIFEVPLVPQAFGGAGVSPLKAQFK